MRELPLGFEKGHLFVELDGKVWLLDTGSPSSFGNAESVVIDGRQFELAGQYRGLDDTKLSRFVGVSCDGLLGANVLGSFDHLLNTATGALTVSAEELVHEGRLIGLDEFMGIPIVPVTIAGVGYRMFFDTGAQISYLEENPLTDFTPAGTVDDFYPGAGRFQTETYAVPIVLGEESFSVRCGSLPDSLKATLTRAGTQGIVGNEILAERTVGYFPRRRTMVL